MASKQCPYEGCQAEIASDLENCGRHEIADTVEVPEEKTKTNRRKKKAE